MHRLLLWLALAPSPTLAAPPAAEAPTGNRPPQVLALNVMPSAPNVGDTVRLRAFGEDPDGDALRWRWTLNGERLPTEAPELVLDAPAGGEYQVQASADDGRGGVADANLRFKVFQPTWCAEAGHYYDEATLNAFYTGAPSLTLSREALVDGFRQALRAGPDAATLADATAAPASDMAALDLEAEVARRAADLGRGLTPADLFAVALTTEAGRVDRALSASLALIEEGDAERLGTWLAPLRDPRGYSREPALRIPQPGPDAWTFVSAAETAGADARGAWSSLFSAAAAAYADRQGRTPFQLVRRGIGVETSGLPALLTAEGVSSAGRCTALSTYAQALEAQLRRGRRGTPDPDRACLAYTGAAIAAALSEASAVPTEPRPADPAPRAVPGDAFGSYLVQSPLSIEVHGGGGEWVGFDQRLQRFTGNTPNAIVEWRTGADGRPAVLISPLFPVQELRLTSAEAGAARFGAADLEAGFSRLWEWPVAAGAAFRYQPAYALTDASGAVIAHAAELHHDRQWAFPQAPMLIIGLAAGLGLVLGLIWVWRRGPFAPAPPLARGSDLLGDKPASCGACGATIRPGARFCRQCGKQLR